MSESKTRPSGNLNRGSDALKGLELHQVQLGGEIGRRIDISIRNNFLKLDLDNDFLRVFRRRVPLTEAKRSERFVGLGLLIEAAVMFASYADDPQVTSRKEYLVAETIKTQSPSGYIGQIVEEPGHPHLWRDWIFSDLAYIVLGLLCDYRHFKNGAALQAGRKLADYLVAAWPHRDRKAVFTTLGTDEAMLELHAATGERRYLEFAACEKMGRLDRIVPASLRNWNQDIHPDRRISSARDFDEEYADVCDGDLDVVSRCHVYRMLARTIMQLRLDRIEPNPRLSVMSHRLLEGLTRPERTAMVITGTASMKEGWHENQDGKGALGENCATVYLLWFMNELLELEGDLRYGDIMERTIYNALFASQEAVGRRIRYFTPFSGPREYFDYDSFCCPNNFRRGIASLAGMVYYQMAEGLAINLFTNSTARAELAENLSVKVRQETDYPNSGNIRIRIAPSRPAEFNVRLRVPRWAEDFRVELNGKPVDAITGADGSLTIFRTWREGDTITLEMPMRWRWVKGREMQKGHAALMRGPVVYCLSRKQNKGLEEVDLREITLAPRTISEPLPTTEVRPDGIQCHIKAWSPSKDLSEQEDLELRLDEFPHPGGEEIYFRIPKGETTVDDELLRSEPATQRNANQ